jgi:hypothetical protein
VIKKNVPVVMKKEIATFLYLFPELIWFIASSVEKLIHLTIYLLYATGVFSFFLSFSLEIHFFKEKIMLLFLKIHQLMKNKICVGNLAWCCLRKQKYSFTRPFSARKRN